MAQTSQAQAFAAPIVKLWSDGMAMAVEGVEVSQAQGKRMLENAMDFSTATGKEVMRTAGELRDRMLEATGSASDLLREQAGMFNDVAKDPMGVGQRVVSSYVEGTRRAMEIGTASMKSVLAVMGSTWSQMEKASQESRESWTQYVNALHAIAEAKAKRETPTV